MPELVFEPLCQPCRAKQVLAGLCVADREDGRDRFYLTNMNETSKGELIEIDFERNQATAHVWPAGDGSWGVIEIPGDRLAVSTYFDGKFLIFDLREKRITHVHDFPGESYIWNMALGGDGRIYGGTYPGAKLGALNPDTGVVEDCGAPTPPNTYLRTVTGTPGGKLLCSLGMAKAALKVYDPKTGTFADLPGEDLAGRFSGAVTYRDHLLIALSGGGLAAFRGPGLDPTPEVPLPACPDAGGWTGMAGFTTDELAWLYSGKRLYRYEAGPDRLELAVDLDLRGGTIYAVSRAGELLGVRGQDYFVLKPGAGDVDLRRIPTEGRGRRMHFLVGDDRGRIWGGPTFGQTVFSFEVATGKVENTGAVVDRGGEVYGAVAHGGKLYTASYSGGDLAVYDPLMPWDQWNHRNPRPLGSVDKNNQIRPTGEMLLGPDGNLYSGWQAIYGRYGGALVRLDPRTERITTWEDPLGEECVTALATDDRRLYLGTGHGANGLPAREGDGHFAVWDIAAEKIVFRQRIPGENSVGRIGVSRTAGKVYVGVGGALRVFDVKSMSFAGTIEADVSEMPEGWGRDFLEREGTMLCSRGPHLLRLLPGEGRIERLGTAPGPIHRMAPGSDGKLYFNIGPTLYRCGV